MDRIKNFFREENKTAKLLAIVTIIGLFVVGNATGVFAAFYRTLNNINAAGVVYPNTYGYGYGYDDTLGSFDYGYGYGYGFNGTCTPIAHAATYNTSCNVATCSTGYSVSTNSCVAVSTGGGGGSYYPPVTTATGSVVTVTKDKNVVTVTVTTSSGTLTRTFTTPGLVLKSLKDVKFTDITSNWAKNYIIHLVARGVINNTEKYNPDNNLTRAEFLKIAFNAAGQKTSSTGTTAFKDVDANVWYTPYIALAVSRGIVSDKFTNFRPNDTISRAEAAKIIVGIFGGDTSNRKVTFSDVDGSSDLMKYIETAKIYGFFDGQMIDGKLKFRPNDSITRAEIAKVVVNAFKL